LQRTAALAAPGAGLELLKRQMVRAEGLIAHLKAKQVAWLAKHGISDEGSRCCRLMLLVPLR
jgi:hypothetical protein